ncbi:hypothetical protein DFH01_11065 [Falsiroseomonas bella]|uniref:Uncharacterized protein n=1 Tax=Falsiroseomonas bella TaxID=2184016 RepID=A0A317FE63_9PROT|nr:hypothetical protein [Falsiroseomonas bella]PWS37374.1 hypothetical protein DFH01_11065 [Falsiroseomonas bella]
MSEVGAETQRPAAPAPPAMAEPAASNWRRTALVHLAMVVAALLGIAYTSLARPAADQPGGGVFWVWIALVPAYFAACLWHGWARASAERMRTRLVVTQALHWLAFLVAMYVMLTPEVRGVLNDNAVGLMLLSLLAMGTFVAGVHAWSAAICATGVLLALAIPVIAWLDENVVLLLVGLSLVVLVGGAVLYYRRLRPAH